MNKSRGQRRMLIERSITVRPVEYCPTLIDSTLGLRDWQAFCWHWELGKSCWCISAVVLEVRIGAYKAPLVRWGIQAVVSWTVVLIWDQHLILSCNMIKVNIQDIHRGSLRRAEKFETACWRWWSSGIKISNLILLMDQIGQTNCFGQLAPHAYSPITQAKT